jgi:hypothetical protein
MNFLQQAAAQTEGEGEEPSMETDWRRWIRDALDVKVIDP